MENYKNIGLENFKYIDLVTEDFKKAVAEKNVKGWDNRIEWNGTLLYINNIDTIERLPTNIPVLILADKENQHPEFFVLYKDYAIRLYASGYRTQARLYYSIQTDRQKSQDKEAALRNVGKLELLDTPKFNAIPTEKKLFSAFNMIIETFEITESYLSNKKEIYVKLKNIFLGAGFTQYNTRFERDLKLNEFVSLNIMIDMGTNCETFHIMNGNHCTWLDVKGDNYLVKAQRIAEFVHETEEAYKKSMGI